ncbi:hypothetical protein AB0M20_34655 [Actinoplanes sp. NPDC051633]|uniref:hypothetical protein n=1 Tax=Actinoplanes sp. NPDC051633 TaxID=3155670 RepID=UPI003440B80F
MTDASQRTQPTDTDPADTDPRRAAAWLHDLLKHDGVEDLRYYGRATVHAGVVMVSFRHSSAEIWFIDNWSNSVDLAHIQVDRTTISMGTLTEIVTALANHLAVSP